MKTELLIPFFSVDERLKKQEQEIVEKKTQINQVKLTYRIDMYPRQYVMQDWIFKLLLAYHDAISVTPIDHVTFASLDCWYRHAVLRLSWIVRIIAHSTIVTNGVKFINTNLYKTSNLLIAADIGDFIFLILWRVLFLKASNLNSNT